jgi:hypothetical protein
MLTSKIFRRGLKYNQLAILFTMVAERFGPLVKT